MNAPIFIQQLAAEVTSGPRLREIPYNYTSFSDREIVVRLLGERFMVIRQAMGVPKARGPEAAAFLRAFVEDMKAGGVVQDSMTRHGIKGAGVAPAADPAQDPLAAP